MVDSVSKSSEIIMRDNTQLLGNDIKLHQTQKNPHSSTPTLLLKTHYSQSFEPAQTQTDMGGIDGVQ
jgi:hypothetical protein